MTPIRIAAAQFETRNGDKEYNLDAMERLVKQAVGLKADVVSFHEVCVPAYSFMRHAERDTIEALAEPVPEGPSTRRLKDMSSRFDVPILAGLVERDGERLYNTYVCVDGDRLVAKFRKLHAFISPHISCGNEYVTFDLKGWRCSILICYDNNLACNVQAVAELGADILFMPHVTCCLEWPIPGSGLVSRELWENRDADPVSLRQEFQGPKGREWLMKWVPARAYDNGLYAVFTNPVGLDDDQVRNGNAMIVDPNGDVIAECNTLGDGVVVGCCTPAKLETAMGRKHLAARRPELYRHILGRPNDNPVIDPSWDLEK
ncbi:MAG: nitrilase [Planctomycetota bacterium]|nr:MAG: nitrilase [Planctomycetota bacterium]REJ95354.1 MAG: nitrilase [Planctomycetota bacterium]REK24453.1 MAG: nitrilase [Planctomycetota bacterium]REK38642.1 MAG: nitrilase [Planctomycetota bacterium]